VNTPIPAVNPCVHVYGSCYGVNSTGILRVKLESIALNIGSNANASAAASSSATSSSAPVTPQKRRKFSPLAVASPPRPQQLRCDIFVSDHSQYRDVASFADAFLYTAVRLAVSLLQSNGTVSRIRSIAGVWAAPHVFYGPSVSTIFLR
jgi:hypothetical protein